MLGEVVEVFGELRDGFQHDTGGQLHTYRIVVGTSRSGFVYANL